MRLTFRTFVVQLPRALGNARHCWARREGVHVALDLDGRRGLGEATPLPGYSPDDITGVTADLAACPTQALEVCPQTAAMALERLRQKWRAGPAARFAVETALLDLWGQQGGVPVHRLLNPLGGPLAPMPLAALLPADPVEEWVAAAKAAVASGHRTLKLKLGRPGRWAAEFTALLAVRKAVGPAVALRLDVNGAWTPAEARVRLEALRAVGPELVEEPVPGERLLELAGSEIPIALDESLQRPGAMAHVQAAVRRGLCTALVLKPTVLGGFSGCARWATYAREQGLDTIVTHTLDGPIALAAAAELALSLPASRPCGLALPADLQAWPSPHVPQIAGPWLVGTVAAGLRGPVQDCGFTQPWSLL